MLNTFNKIFKFTLIFSAVISAWTSIILLSSTTSNVEINEVLKRMYLNQRNFILNVKELSLLLVTETNDRFSEINQDVIDSDNQQNGFKK